MSSLRAKSLEIVNFIENSNLMEHQRNQFHNLKQRHRSMLRKQKLKLKKKSLEVRYIDSFKTYYRKGIIIGIITSRRVRRERYRI